MKLINTLFLIILIKGVMGQMNFQYPYFPKDFATASDWKIQVSPFISQQAGSNTFTNGFFNSINKSQYLNDELIDRQIENMTGNSLAGQITSGGIGIKINSDKNPRSSVYLVYEHQQFLDASLDDDFIKLLMKGNKSFAGQTLYIPYSKYYNISFNKIKAGMVHQFVNKNPFHRLSWLVGLNIGQNFNNIEISNSSFYTQPDGDYLDITASVKTELSDTVWAEIYKINGYGFSADLEYNYTKPESFHFGVTIKNLGLIFWNGDTFTGEMDTSFVFNGISNDTLNGGNENLPDDFSYNNLRRILYKETGAESFSKGLPISLSMTAGKFISEERFYIGLAGNYYPMLEANFDLEAFGTWNFKNTLFLTPVVSYGSYGNMNAGLGIGLKILKSLQLQVGSKYLNSMFNKNAKLGSGGFGRLVFVL